MQGLRIRVRGQVQGVGFRPFVWQVAQRFELAGHVLNDPEGVLIFAAGKRLDGFLTALRADKPPLAQVDALEVEPFHFESMPEAFVIAPSQGQGAETRVTPDAATCADCIDDIFGTDPRRQGYAFTNCTHCGPRFTILKGLPYDRAQTTMAAFAMCDACAAEYADPGDRRFHAQPVACANCGPQLWYEDNGQKEPDAIAAAAEAIEAGKIIAVKGLGGFHLCCDATNPAAIETLRARKRRPAKPLALMGTAAQVSQYARISPEEEEALHSAAAPIVLLEPAMPLPDCLAPGQSRLGWMLPYTPLHHLLLHAVGKPLVMTSGNLSGEPQVKDNDEALEKLHHLVDGFVMHDRDIARRLDDSVMRITPQGPMILRHARGRVPGTFALPEGFEDAPHIVAFGGQMKSAICLIKERSALLSHHLGDLDDLLTWEEFEKADADYADLFDHAPTVFACDLHPDYRASQYALARAGSEDLIEVQHHHAHMCAAMAENGWPRNGGAVAGIILDGLGLGSDGTIWGGELLLGDYASFERIAHLTPAPLVGGDRAQTEPWRNALFRLDEAGLGQVADDILAEFPRDILRQAALSGLNSVASSSAGRLFDAVAAILGICLHGQSFEGEAAMQLEAMAAPNVQPYPFGPDLCPTPMIQAIVQDLNAGRPKSEIAGRFHAGLAVAFAMPARELVISGRAQAVALSGGCFQNALLLDRVVSRLRDVPVLLQTQFPANDGSLALGQAISAAAISLNNR